jgi:exodeoxyribonuclease V alpha subunit
LAFPPTSDCRVQAAVTFELSHNENNGHVFLPRDKLIAATVQLLGCEEELAQRALDGLVERKAVICQSRWPTWTPAISGGSGRRRLTPAPS